MRPKKNKKRSSLNFEEKIRKNTENSEKYFGKFGKILSKIRKNTSETKKKGPHSNFGEKSEKY